MLYLTVDVLERFPEAQEKWQKAFRYVLVDEYQDTNHAQYRFLQLLAEKHKNVFAVGDPDQSIYAFRGADIRNVLEFERDFPGAKSIALEQNYRSTNSILEAANARHLEQPRAQAEEPLVGARRRRARARRRGGGRARRGALRRRRDRAARRGGLQRQRDRRLLPDERAEPRARGRARPPGRRVPGDRRPALLRARRGQGSRRVPPGDRQPVRRRLAPARREPPAPRHRRLDAREADVVRRRRGDVALGGDGPHRSRRRRHRPREGGRVVPHADPVAHVGRRRSSRCRS